MNNYSSEFNDFIYLKSKIAPEKRRKMWPGIDQEEIPYKPDEEEKELIDRDVRDQIISTISSIKGKKMRDDERVYFVLGVSIMRLRQRRDSSRAYGYVFYPDVLSVLKRLSAEVLVYLNMEHNKLLISCTLSKLNAILEEEKYKLQYFQVVKRISPLMPEEQISKYLREDSQWPTMAKPILIQIIPNISNDKREQYINIIHRYLIGANAEPSDFGNTGFISANLNEESTKELLQSTNFVFKVSELPQGTTEKLNYDKVKTKGKRSRRIEGIVSSMDLKPSKFDELPIICLLDSGVEDIPQLTGLVILKDGYNFLDYNDGKFPNGHGTPIACLAVYGEELNIPKARIISYKIYSDNERNKVFQGYVAAINKYSKQSRIFLSSINFEKDNPEATAEISKLLQQNNICMVVSAGNIDPKLIFDFAAKGIPYYTYIGAHPIQQPAQAITIAAVGSISNKDSPISIAHKDELSPFSRCGTANIFLYQCPKPEVVQHGGNCCKDHSIIGLESFNRSGIRVDNFAGTSYSAPLFTRNLAEIEAKYGAKIQNAETIKAITLASSNRSINRCMGFGETKPFICCDRLHALVFSEGTIPLPDTLGKEYSNYFKAEISVKIPKRVRSIEMFIVHSDNNFRMHMPCLNTFLKVYAKKTGREYGSVDLDNPDELNKKSHMKIFRWTFKRQSMEGEWTFKLEPEITADMLAEHKKETTIRYGCAILVTSRTPSRLYPLSQEIYNLNKIN